MRATSTSSFSELPLEPLEVFRALLPVFELLLEGLAFELLHYSFGSLAFHANAIEGLSVHARSPCALIDSDVVDVHVSQAGVAGQIHWPAAAGG